jgi:transcriptional regulator with XRE-family HTH domain
MPRRPDPIDILIGRNIRIYRLSKQMSQAELGNGLGVTFQQVQKYEKGANRVGGARLFRLAQILDVPVQAFFKGASQTQAADSAHSAHDLIADAASIRLLQAFSTIHSPEIRHSLITLTEKLARQTR